MRVPNRLAVSVAAVAAGASLITAAPAMADTTTPTDPASVGATTQALTVPAAPTGLIALAGDGMATINFTPAADGGSASSYEYSLDGGGVWTPLSDLTATGATAIITGLVNGQTYQVSLRAANVAGPGLASDPVVVTPFAPVVEPAPVVQPAPAAPVVQPAPAAPVVEPAPAAPVVEPAPAAPVVEPAPAAPEVAPVVEPAPAAPEVVAPAAQAAPAVVAPAAVAPAAPVVAAPDAAYAKAVAEAVAAKWRYEAAIRQAVAAKMRYEAAVREAVAAKMRQQAYLDAVRAAVAAKMRAAAAASSSVGYAAMQNALSRLGAPYVWGGQGPWGFDCSGLVAWSFQTAGYYLPGGSFNQINYGSYVDYYSLRPGDLVFYGPGGSQHVAIYIGNGNVVQASNYNTGVHIASIWYIGSPTAYKRI